MCCASSLMRVSIHTISKQSAQFRTESMMRAGSLPCPLRCFTPGYPRGCAHDFWQLRSAFEPRKSSLLRALSAPRLGRLHGAFLSSAPAP